MDDRPWPLHPSLKVICCNSPGREELIFYRLAEETGLGAPPCAASRSMQACITETSADRGSTSFQPLIKKGEQPILEHRARLLGTSLNRMHERAHRFQARS